MKIYIFSDMEGISGICSSEFVCFDRPLYATGRRYMLNDINACVRGCFKAGADEVLVRDGHSSGLNISWSELDPRVELVQGNSGDTRFPGIEGSDALILLGYHAMAGTAAAVLEHTFDSKSIQNMWLNGEKVGEFAFDAAIAAEHGVPTIMVSGDDKACAEALAWLPSGLTACQVKEGLSTQGAKLLPQEKALALIESKTCEAISKLRTGSIKPKVLQKPFVIRKEMLERLNPGRNGVMLDARTVELSGDNLEKTFFAII